MQTLINGPDIDPEQPLETPTDTTSAAHAEEETAREEDPDTGAETAAQAGEPDAEANLGATQIEAASAASQGAAENPAAGLAEVAA